MYLPFVSRTRRNAWEIRSLCSPLLGLTLISKPASDNYARAPSSKSRVWLTSFDPGPINWIGPAKLICIFIFIFKKKDIQLEENNSNNRIGINLRDHTRADVSVLDSQLVSHWCKLAKRGTWIIFLRSETTGTAVTTMLIRCYKTRKRFTIQFHHSLLDHWLEFTWRQLISCEK